MLHNNTDLNILTVVIYLFVSYSDHTYYLVMIYIERVHQLDKLYELIVNKDGQQDVEKFEFYFCTNNLSV